MGERRPMAANLNKYRTTKDIIVPRGTRVIFIRHIKQEAYRLAQALVGHGPDMQSEWTMSFDDALKAGLIEKIE